MSKHFSNENYYLEFFFGNQLFELSLFNIFGSTEGREIIWTSEFSTIFLFMNSTKILMKTTPPSDMS